MLASIAAYLVGFVQRYDTTVVASVVEKQLQANCEERTCCISIDEGAAEVDNGQSSGFKAPGLPQILLVLLA